MTDCATVDMRGSGVVADGCCGSRRMATRNALNGTATPRPKTMTSELGSDLRVPVRPRWPWGSIAVALLAVAAVVAGELWAFREAPALATSKSEVASELGSTLARVVAASVLVAPAD